MKALVLSISQMYDRRLVHLNNEQIFCVDQLLMLLIRSIIYFFHVDRLFHLLIRSNVNFIMSINEKF